MHEATVQKLLDDVVTFDGVCDAVQDEVSDYHISLVIIAARKAIRAALADALAPPTKTARGRKITTGLGSRVFVNDYEAGGAVSLLDGSGGAMWFAYSMTSDYELGVYKTEREAVTEVARYYEDRYFPLTSDGT